MTVADEQVALIGSVLDAFAIREPEPVCGPFADAFGLCEALQPIVSITIKLGIGPAPGIDPEQNASWLASVALARRDVLQLRAAGVDHGLAAGNLRLLERIDELVDDGADRDRDELARQRVDELVDARTQGWARGLQLSAGDRRGERNQDLARGWLLRHPTDHWLCNALSNVSDAACRDVIESHIDTLAASYQRLCELDWSSEQAAADAIFEVRVLKTPAGWKQPVSAVVTRSVKGSVPLHERVAVCLVEDPAARAFNGTLVSMLGDQQWLMYARARDDGAFLPLDGTRRLPA